MKRELAEEDKQQPMFSKFHHLSSSAAAAAGDYPEADSHTPPNAADGATIEVVRRPRGRPPGSKNKPKPPVIITRDAAEPAMSPYVLELPGGVDIVDSTARFCRKRNIGLCLLSGSGAGQVVGGHVVGSLISAGTIYLVAANFSNPSFHRLQAAEQEEENSGGHDSPKTPPPPAYTYPAENDVVWAPANRHQPPPPPY
ncbi:hypothetical protein SASPL_137258 [Salvia splendens]|uniref:AT-hook motif nuclear-localized protein n=1 Tax=Salvia splendens TaxID=180675 RepID=A0A8X8ZD91_SALSN|nr:hypothetical protein SASPL_137258 [Salvia splendens]